MRSFVDRLAVLGLLALGICSCSVSSEAETRETLVTPDDRTRSYLLHVPTTAPRGLVLALHGGGGTGRAMESLTHLSDVADEFGFLVAYPNGFKRTWNDGRAYRGYDSQTIPIDDVTFLSLLIDRLVQRFQLNPAKVYVTGISNGAMMSYRLACQLSGKVAAAAPVAASFPVKLLQQCTPTRRIPLVTVVGAADPLVPYGGGCIGRRGECFGRVLSVRATLSFWTDKNECTALPTVTRFPHLNRRDPTRVELRAYQCAGGSEIHYYEVFKGGHTWPGGRQYLPVSLVGPTSRDIDASRVILEFFNRH